MPREVDINEFAQKVERLCDFLISKATKNGTDDIRVLQDLKEDAANLQFDKRTLAGEAIAGLSAFMKGANVP